jgi:two-component system chemotaxis sensor kinase CheA
MAIALKETVKVDATRLDRLLDAIGELVIAESMVLGSPELKRSLSPALVQKIGQLDKITRELQEMGTSLRMVPVRPTFQKMQRLVRDLSKNSGKAVDFVVEGEETELDKTVVEKISDPLVHMLRKSLDHGIESDPEERVRAGKPRTAKVRLSAFQKGGNVCIEITDDGRGLNRDVILAKARERGLWREEAPPSDKEIFGFIFEAGFSTAKQVTELSGRGVGMDVVKRNIESLRGRIDIQSRPGQGTTFSIWLPLSLAIIDGMVVRIGEDRFIFPTLSIVCIATPAPEAIHTVQGQGEMLRLQEELIPIYPLHGLLCGDHSGERRLLVVAEGEGRKAAFPVDELLDQQQIVIKKLEESFPPIPGISGGAILTDGRVGLILDVDALMKFGFQP